MLFIGIGITSCARVASAMKLSGLLLVLLTCGCSQHSATIPTVRASPASHSRAAQRTWLREKLKTVTVTDGISKSEAELIAKCYFAKHVGCGVFTGIRDGGDYWIVDGGFGFAGVPIHGFYIDKSSGEVTSPVGPSYATPFEIFP